MKLHAIHTACGIETEPMRFENFIVSDCMQSIPLAVLKLISVAMVRAKRSVLHAIHTACGIETRNRFLVEEMVQHCMQSIPLAVLKRHDNYHID